VTESAQVSVIGLRQLAALEQLTSLGFCQVREFSPLPPEADIRKQMTDILPGCSYAIVNKVCVHGRKEGAPVSTVLCMLLAYCPPACHGM